MPETSMPQTDYSQVKITHNMVALSADLIIIIVFASILVAFLAFVLVKALIQRSKLRSSLNWRRRNEDKNNQERTFNQP